MICRGTAAPLVYSACCFHCFVPHRPHPSASLSRGGARTHLVRVAVDLATGQTTYSRLARRTLEFPSVNPDWHGRPHRYLYCGGDAVDDETYWAPLQVRNEGRRLQICRLQLSAGQMAVMLWRESCIQLSIRHCRRCAASRSRRAPGCAFRWITTGTRG